MQKLKKGQSARGQASQKHSRNPSAQRQRDSHPRLTICCSPPQNRKANNYLSNPNSLEKKKPKAVKKHAKNKKHQQQQATRETIETTGEEHWKDHLKLTFRSKKHPQKEITLRNNSLKCMEELTPIDSYASLVNTFPQQDKNQSLLGSKERIYLVDWLGFIAAELLLRKNTVHLAVAIIDGFIDQKGVVPQKIQALGAGALLLAVKQEERGSEGDVLAFLSSSDTSLTKDQIIKIESNIILGLSFKLNFSTLPFWFDYFSQKWDNFSQLKLGKQGTSQLSENHLVCIRSPQGHCYQHYREAIQLIDALLMHPLYQKRNFSKLSLAVLYLVARIQTEVKIDKKESNEMYSVFFEGFSKKASPIFRDRHCFNEIFNEFVVEVCDFEMTEIIPDIRLLGTFLNMGFTYEIDSRIYESSLNYEQFLRFSTYSQHIRNYFLTKFQ